MRNPEIIILVRVVWFLVCVISIPIWIGPFVVSRLMRMADYD